MTTTLLDFLMILSLGILAGTGIGLCIGFFTKKQKRDWTMMQIHDKLTTAVLILACSAIITAILGWYIFWYAVM